MGLNEISSKIKRTIRGINIKDTLGMHYYKLGAVGMAYWEIRLKEAKDLMKCRIVEHNWKSVR